MPIPKSEFIDEYSPDSEIAGSSSTNTEFLIALLDTEVIEIIYYLNKNNEKAYNTAELATALGAPEIIIHNSLAPVRVADRKAGDATPDPYEDIQFPIRHSVVGAKHYYLWQE